MHKLFFIIAICLTFPLHGQDLLNGERQLAYRLQAGKTYRIEIDLQQSTRSESMDSEEISFSSNTAMDFQLDSIDLEGVFYLRTRYHGLLLSMLAPRLKLEINSGSEKNPLLSQMLKELELHEFRMSMNSRGELLSLQGLEEIFIRLQDFPASDSAEKQVIFSSLAEAFGPTAFQSLHGLFLHIYPVIPSMKNWTNDITYFFNTRPVPLVNRYYLGQSKDEQHIIQGLGMLNSQQEFIERTGMGRVKSTVSGSQTYDFHVDSISGWPLRCMSRQRLVIETTILESDYLPSGLKIPSYTETVFDLKGSILP